uniref:Phostensin/Taperin PP1-binding domain-containing protein n=1 Tax=Oncorhynchus mykiss TaxID=8022 RepID=A0A8K9XQL0_ONCMY
MSVSSLPEWKQLLLERKRREEEEREKREKEEEDKLASMPAWKRGIIQRRRMKQEMQLGSEPPLSPDITGPWLDEEAKPQCLVLKETIIPVGQNSFIRTHGGWRRGREAERAGEMGHEKGNEQEIEVGRERQKEKERGHVKGHDGESGKGRDIEIQIERYRDRSGGRERDRSAGRETSRDTVRDRERDCPRGRKEEEREEGDSNSPTPNHVYPKKSVLEVTPKCPKSPKCFASVGIPPMPLEIHIPRTVFYGVGEASLQSEYDRSCEGEGGKGVERKDSCRIGKPLSHIESLREKSQQREKERLRNMEGVATTGDDGDATEGTEKAGTRRTRKASCSDWCEEGEMGNEIERERQRQEGSPPQTTSTQFDSNQPKQARSITINSRSVLTPSPENLLHPDQGVPTTPSASPSQSTSVSPSPSPSPTHFTIRSLSGGQQVKRGTTITITPRKPLANTSAQSQMPVLTEEGERGKKRYPTAEEIEVIGGYQNLDKSCLVKTSKASPKGVSVDCRLAYCRLCTINCIDEVSHLVVMIMGSHHLRLCLRKTQLVKQNENSRKWLE